jgi:hypothetical protein
LFGGLSFVVVVEFVGLDPAVLLIELFLFVVSKIFWTFFFPWGVVRRRRRRRRRRRGRLGGSEDRSRLICCWL